MPPVAALLGIDLVLAFKIRLDSQLVASSKYIVTYSYQYMLCSEHNNTCMRLGLGTFRSVLGTVLF